MSIATGKRVPLGRVVATSGVCAAVPEEVLRESLQRHVVGDWGDCGPEDWSENDFALVNGFRLFSVYHTREGATLWVITEADRSSTTVLLPDEY